MKKRVRVKMPIIEENKPFKDREDVKAEIRKCDLFGARAPIAYVLSWPMEILLDGLIGWDIVMPLATASLAILFRRTTNTRHEGRND
jgi:hypothetical protein